MPWYLIMHCVECHYKISIWNEISRGEDRTNNENNITCSPSLLHVATPCNITEWCRKRKIFSTLCLPSTRTRTGLLLSFLWFQMLRSRFFSHALNQLTHVLSRIMRFLLVIFFINCTRLKARAINEKNDSKKSHNALEAIR